MKWINYIQDIKHSCHESGCATSCFVLFSRAADRFYSVLLAEEERNEMKGTFRCSVLCLVLPTTPLLLDPRLLEKIPALCFISRTYFATRSPGSWFRVGAHVWLTLHLHQVDWGVASQSHWVRMSRKAFIPTIVTLEQDFNPENGSYFTGLFF